MPTIKCSVCGKEIEISEFQFRMMQGTIMTCGYECAVKAAEKEWKR